MNYLIQTEVMADSEALVNDKNYESLKLLNQITMLVVEYNELMRLNHYQSKEDILKVFDNKDPELLEIVRTRR